MAIRSLHLEKAQMFWDLAGNWHRDKRTEFMCINLVMYAVGHLIEAVLAEDNRHPGCAARGVPHGDRDVLMRRYLVGGKRLEAVWADTYSELVSRRDTFIDGGPPTRQAVENYRKLAEPLVVRLKQLIDVDGVSAKEAA